MRPRWGVQGFLLLILPLVVGVVGSCDGDDDPGVTAPTPADLAGTYDLASIEFPPNPAVEPPIATGTLRLTERTYEVTINVQGQEPIEDNGTFQISEDGTWSQSSAVTKVQSTGTFTFDGNQLSVEVIQPAPVNTVWDKR